MNVDKPRSVVFYRSIKSKTCEAKNSYHAAKMDRIRLRVTLVPARGSDFVLSRSYLSK